MNLDEVHYVTYAAQPDLLIVCNNEWTTPFWGPEPDLPKDVYLADNGMLYTFRPSNVTCKTCSYYAELESEDR